MQRTTYSVIYICIFGGGGGNDYEDGGGFLVSYKYIHISALNILSFIQSVIKNKIFVQHKLLIYILYFNIYIFLTYLLYYYKIKYLMYVNV